MKHGLLICLILLAALAFTLVGACSADDDDDDGRTPDDDDAGDDDAGDDDAGDDDTGDDDAGDDDAGDDDAGDDDAGDDDAGDDDAGDDDAGDDDAGDDDAGDDDDDTEPQRVLISDINDRQFLVSWLTEAAVVGQVEVATSPGGPFEETFDDIRVDEGYDPTGNAHQVRVNLRTAETDYYFNIISGGDIYSDPGYEVTTGAWLSQNPDPSDYYFGYTYNCEGSATIDDILVVMVVENGAGQTSVARANLVFKMLPGGSEYVYAVDLSNSRRSDDYDEVIDYLVGDTITVTLDGILGPMDPFTIVADPDGIPNPPIYVNYCPAD